MTYPPAPTMPMAGWPATRPAPDQTALPLIGDVNIQGNVLAGFNKDHQVLFFLHWADPVSARAWLSELRPRLARNADVAAFNARFGQAKKRSGRDPEMTATWNNVSFTAAGIELLAPQDMTTLRQHPSLDAGLQLWLTGAADATVAGRVGDTGPSDPSSWLFGSAGPVIHALVCVAADRTEHLITEVAFHRELSARHEVGIVFEQTGDTLPGTAAGHEHFGFKDGISQPGVFGFDPASTDPAHAGEVDKSPALT